MLNLENHIYGGLLLLQLVVLEILYFDNNVNRDREELLQS
jgi:hypothetical protein